jgi:hypothetical protein
LFGEPETVPDKKFFAGKYITNGTFPSAHNEGAYSIVEPIGFAIEINGKTYTEFSVATAGWIFLRDPAGGSTGGSFWTDILNGFTNIYDNHQISATFSYDHIFLPAWFDKNYSILRNVSDLAAAPPNGYYSTLTSDIQNDIVAGINTKYWPYDSIDYGVRYVNHYDNKKGKCLLVRWTVTQEHYGNRLKFEIALFENGTIEYRYWPIKTFEPGDVGGSSSSTATVGVFWRQVGKSYLWRDFAPLLGYSSSTDRKLSQLGGAEYDPLYIDGGQYYSNNISATNWPKNGAVITYSPPVKPLKILPRKIIGEMNSTREIVRSPGLFDDRRTIPFVSGGFVHMPSTLPTRLIGDSGNIDVSLQQLLFVSGSDSGSLFIPSNGRVSKSAVDTQLAQLEAIEKTNKAFDFSFNEGQKNYEATYSSDSFYATGSSVDDFGSGFSSPLKSKTQFSFSLPVTKQTTMPSLTSSFYYYDNNLQRWTHPATGFIPRIKTKTVHSDVVQGDYDAYYTYIVTETAIGFDAVGRKVVSGTLPNALDSTSRQSDFAIGAFFNAPASRKIGVTLIDFVEKDVSSQSTSIEKKLGNTITDNINFFPSSSLAFDANIEYPFLVEKIVAEIPFYISGDWFADKTTCNKAFGDVGIAAGLTSGSIDFGGPGITFALLCGRKSLNRSYLDIIASGTITHVNDDTKDVVLYKNPGMNNYVLRPVGFKSFSNATIAISGGSSNVYDGRVRLELTPSVAGGLTLARNDRSIHVKSNGSVDYSRDYNRTKCVQLLTSPTLVAVGESEFNAYDNDSNNGSNYANRSTRIYLQQLSPLSRGTTGVEFNGNSILGGNVAHFNLESNVNNPLYYSSSGSLSSELKTKIDSANFAFEAISLYSVVDSRQSPYLLMPGDKLSISLSKTRPVIYKMFRTATIGGAIDDYGANQLTGSHGTVMLNTGSIDITLYGSYVRGGVEFNP